MKAIMNLNALKNTEKLQSFLNGSQAVAFSLPGKKRNATPLFSQPWHRVSLPSHHQVPKRRSDSVFITSNRLFPPVTDPTDSPIPQ